MVSAENANLQLGSFSHKTIAVLLATDIRVTIDASHERWSWDGIEMRGWPGGQLLGSVSDNRFGLLVFNVPRRLISFGGWRMNGWGWMCLPSVVGNSPTMVISRLAWEVRGRGAGKSRQLFLTLWMRRRSWLAVGRLRAWVGHFLGWYARMEGIMSGDWNVALCSSVCG